MAEATVGAYPDWLEPLDFYRCKITLEKTDPPEDIIVVLPPDSHMQELSKQQFKFAQKLGLQSGDLSDLDLSSLNVDELDTAAALQSQLLFVCVESWSLVARVACEALGVQGGDPLPTPRDLTVSGKADYERLRALHGVLPTKIFSRIQSAIEIHGNQ